MSPAIDRKGTGGRFTNSKIIIEAKVTSRLDPPRPSRLVRLECMAYESVRIWTLKHANGRRLGGL